MITVIIFIIILAILVFVHELGHFLVAKSAGIRVDEFGLGFPPKLISKKVGETTYSLNAVPFGGFVKIFGEDPDEESMFGPDHARSIVHKPKIIQVAVLIAGVSFNVIFAWLIISFGFMIGLPSSTSAYPEQTMRDVRVVVTHIAPDSPAQEARLKEGDKIISLQVGNDTQSVASIEDVQNFVFAHPTEASTLTYKRGQDIQTASITPVEGIVDGKPAIGIGMDTIGLLRLPFFSALAEGAKLSVYLIKMTAVGLSHFIFGAVTGNAALSEVTGPVGIARLVGDVNTLGFVYLLSFTALISVNLALINLIPFPALDGGRILFIIIEAIKGSPIRPKIANMLNTIGFALLILLMLVVTFHDISKLF